MHTSTAQLDVCMSAFSMCAYTCICVCMCVCMYVYIYIYIHTKVYSRWVRSLCWQRSFRKIRDSPPSRFACVLPRGCLYAQSPY